MNKYTLEEIKEAFWGTFHESGEQWFDYLDTDEENEESTNSTWLEFKDELDNIFKDEFHIITKDVFNSLKRKDK